jgi:hypothetical protein
VCYTYVNDTDLVHSGDHSTPLTQVFGEMQSMLDHWEEGLHATGGALVRSKSYWYGLDYKWHKTKMKWDYKTIAQSPGSLSIKDHHCINSRLDRLEVDEAQQTLGLWIAMNGNQKRQVLALIEKVLEWADKIRTKELTRTEAWLSLRMGIAKALQYPLTATNMSKTECKLIDKKLLHAALPALGFPSSYPQVIAQAPPEVLGLGIPSLWNEQDLEHVAAMLRHGDSPEHNVTGCLMCDVISTLRQELGLPGFPFEHPYPRFHRCTTRMWLHSTWEFCNEHAFQV